MTFRCSLLAKAALAICLVLPAPAAAQPGDPLLQTLHTFQGGATDGATPVAPLIVGADGNFYGTTLEGGTANLGTVFRMTPAGVTTVLHAFAGGAADGASPRAGLLIGTDGQFYGTTSAGGAANLGVVFRMTTAGTVTILHAFAGAVDGATPYGELLEAPDGFFYGTTRAGGSANAGVIFKMSPAGVLTTLHTFAGANGSDPRAGLVRATDGLLYGTAATGGTFAAGVVFRIAPDGTFEILHNYGGAAGPLPATPEGAGTPTGRMFQAADGFVYGTSDYEDGPAGRGEVFRVGLDGSFSFVTEFRYDDAWHSSAIMQASNGELYATSPRSNTTIQFPEGGTIYSLSARMANPADHGILHVFSGSDGFTPMASLVQGADGNLYGTTSSGPGGSGTVFRYLLTQPAMNIDLPANNAVVGPSFSIHGWAIDRRSQDGPGVDAVTVWAQSTAGGSPLHLDVAIYGTTRTDVGAAFGSQFTGSGFSFTVNSLAPGVYDLLVYAHSRVANVTAPPQSIRVTVGTLTSNPVMSLESPASGAATQPLVISGWAVDLAEPSGTGVDAIHVYAYPNPGSGQPPVFLGSAPYGASRPDVAAAFGDRFRTSGFSLIASGLTPGLTYQIVAYARSTVNGTFNNASAADVTLRTTEPQMALESPAPGSIVSPSFLLKGWALDRASASGPGILEIHAWAQPIDGGPALFLGVGHYGQPRPDVGAAFGPTFTDSGFTVSVTALPANRIYDVSVYARSALTGTFNNVRVVRLSVAASTTTVIALDTPGSGATVAQGFTLSGWAIDPSVATGTGVDAVEIWAYAVSAGGAPVALGAAAYGGARPDVAAAFGSRFANSAFTLAAPPLPAGTYDLIVYARRAGGPSTGLPPVRVVVNP